MDVDIDPHPTWCDVIVLNGASSTGKTTISGILQGRLPGAWAVAGIDTVTAMLPHLPPAPDPERVHEVAASWAVLRTEFLRYVGTCARRGVPLVIEWICQEGAAEQRAVLDALEGVRCCWVNLTADLTTLQARERLRGDRGAGLAAFHASRVYRGVQADLRLDTSTLPPQECAALIVAHASRQTVPG